MTKAADGMRDERIGQVLARLGLRVDANGQVSDPLARPCSGPALASMLIYLLMAIVLAARPQGLFPVRHG